jgi:outer membrane protein insertion porin family
VEIELQEGKPLSILYGVGYQYTPDAPSYASDPFLVGGVSYNNLFGRMLSAGLEGQISVSGRYRLQLSYRDPYLFNRDLTLTSYFFATREPIQDVDIDRLGLVNEVSHYFGHYLRVALRQEYQRITPVNPENLSFIEANDFPRFDQPIKEATIGPTAFYDRRDDPIDPHRGYYTSLAVKYAFPLFSAEARYTKFSTQAAYFQPIGKSVVAGSLRLGGIFPYGPPTIQVPIAERFFAGGQSTGRGFEQDLLGIPGESVDYDTRATLHTGSGNGSCAPTFPNAAAYDCNAGPHIVGGNGFFAANAEFRFPIFGDLGGTVFYDLAQVWREFADLNFRFEGEDGLRQTAGIGLRYMTPIGPLRAEYGMPLQPKMIPYDITTTTDADGNCAPGTVLERGRCVLGHGTVKEKGRFIITIGYAF